MNGNGDLLKAIGELLDEKLTPIRHDISELQRDVATIRTLAYGLADTIARIEIRLRVVEAILGIDPYKPKH